MTVLEPVINYLTTLKKGVNITLTEVIGQAQRPRKPVLRVLDRLTREGFLDEISDEKIAPRFGEVGRCRRNPTWKLIDHPVYVNPKSPKRRTHRDRIWKAMRDKRKFTRKDLVRVTGCSMASVESYTKLLEYHGIIRVLFQYRNLKTYVLPTGKATVKRPIVREIKKKC